MEELGHQFFVFVNAETERVAILYARTTATTASSSRSSAASTPRARADADGNGPRPGRRDAPRRQAGPRRYSPASRVTRPASTIPRRIVATSGWKRASRWLTSFSG